MRKTFAAVLCALAFGPPPAFAGNAIAHAVQELHLSPQQLLSLRDFLGPFGRGGAVDEAGGGLFILRDAATMAYLGAFTLRVNDRGALEIERIAGPAALDASHIVNLSFRLDRKSAAKAAAALAGSQALAPAAAPGAGLPVPIGKLPGQPLSGARPIDATATGTVMQSKAVFFRDGSGYARSVRTQIPATGDTAAAFKLTDRYYAPMRSDGTQVWRDSLVEVDIEAPLAFAALEQRYGCAAGTGCKPAGPSLVPAASHLIAWSHQLVPAVPAQLLAEIASPPPNDEAQAAAPQPPTNIPAGAPQAPQEPVLQAEPPAAGGTQPHA